MHSTFTTKGTKESKRRSVKLTPTASAKAKPQNIQKTYSTGNTSAPPRLCEKPTQHIHHKRNKRKQKAKRKITPVAFAKAQRSKNTKNNHSKPVTFASFAPLREI